MKTDLANQLKTPLLHQNSSQALKNALNSEPHALLVLGGEIGNHAAIASVYADNLAKKLNVVVSRYEDQDVSIELVREIRNLVRSAGTKVVLIPSLDGASSDAQNALLKALEEPSQGTYFVLSATNSDAVLQTVESRTHTIELQTPRVEDFMRVHEDHSEDEIKTALRASGGSYPSFIAYLSGERDEYELAKQFVVGTPQQRMAIVSTQGFDRPTAIRIVGYVQSIYVYFLETQTKAVELNKNRVMLCQQTSKRLSANGNIKLLLDELSINL